MKRIFAAVFLLMLLSVGFVSAAPKDAEDTAIQIYNLLESRVPYDVTFTPAQMASAGYDTVNMTRNGTYRILVKDVEYNLSNGQATLWVNAWWNGNSIQVNNPVHMYLPWSGGVKGANAATQLRGLAFIVISYLDNKPLGSPVNDDTLLVYPTTDGYSSEMTDAAYSTMRGDVGDNVANAPTTAQSSPQIRAASTTDVYNYMRRTIFSFNTSALPDDCTINSAVVSVWTTGKTGGLGSANYGITGGTLADNTTLASGDYDGFGNTRYASDIVYASIASGGRNNWSMNADGLAAISKTKFTIIYLRDNWDIDNSFGGTWVSGSFSYITFNPVGYATESERPYLEIIYTPASGDTTPPSSLTNFANTTTCSQTNISFTKPSDSDYDGFMVWWNNVAGTNQTNATIWYNKSGLSASTSYTISTKTFDLVGNVNATFQNYTVVTPACADTTPPSSITGLTNTSVTCNQLFFNWTNPADSDFAGIMVWRNNTALTNLTNSTTGVSWAGLPESTAITFSSKTFDLVGNVNASFVNMTRDTAACGSAPVAAFSANNLSSCSNVNIVFTDASTNIPTGWSWAFKNATAGWSVFSTSQNPAYPFPTGNYSINLTASNAYGTDDEVKTNYLIVADCIPPTPTPTPTAAAFTDWPWCADQDMFFRNDSSNISGYRVIDHRPEIAPQYSLTSAPFVTGDGEIVLGTWATPAGSPGVSVLGPGLWRFRTYAYASSSSGATTLKFYVINRSASGNETDLFYGNAITRDIDKTTVPTEYLTSYARRNYTAMFPGDRLVIRVNATTDSTSARTVTLDLAGNTNASMVGVSYFLCDSSGVGSAAQIPPSVPIGIGIPVVAAVVVFALYRKR